MKNIFYLFVFLFSITASIHAQKVYFVYLQTESQQPFYARMGDKIYNSNPTGYLILSNLRDSIYSINIGLQGNQAPDQPYAITVNRKDQGFLLKNFGEKGWGLFNLSTMAVIMPSTNSTAAVQVVRTEKREGNEFTDLLAKAADDSTIKERPIIETPVEKKTDSTIIAAVEKKNEPRTEVKEEEAVKENEINKETTTIGKREEAKADSVAIQKQIDEEKRLEKLKEDSILEVKRKEDELIKQEEKRIQDSIDKSRMEKMTEIEYKRSTVKLKSESSTTTGIGLVFIDYLADNIIDTIRILIPPDNKKAPPIEQKQEDKKFLDITTQDSVNNDLLKKEFVKQNNCRVIATDDDFFKLRKRMAGENRDDNMIEEATKIFKTKCFSTTQIKNLSTLFLTDEYKYKFFDASYQYVNDVENFASLQAELKDDYYINRFKAMLRL